MIKQFIKNSALICAVMSAGAYAEPASVWVESYTPPHTMDTRSAPLLNNDVLHHKKETPVIVLENLTNSNETLKSRSYKLQRENTLGTPLHAGVKRAVSATDTSEKLASYLDWETLVDGSHIAALSIISPQALGNRFILEIEQLHPRAELRFSDETSGEVFTVSGEDVINTIFKDKQTAEIQDLNKNIYIGPYINGDKATLEIYLPKDISPTNTKISIPVFSHMFTSPEKIDDDNDMQCMVNVACNNSWNSVSNGVAKMLFTDAHGDSYVCTGTLINDKNSSLTPNFLTADHCIDSQQLASTLQTFWFYKTTSCASSTANSSIKLTRGADLLFNQSSTDTTLLRLREQAPAGAMFLGWTSAAAKNMFVGVVHHPNGIPQKLSTGYTANSYVDCKESADNSFSCQTSILANAGYLPVSYNRGATAGGSSGSGLFITGNNTIGTLGEKYLVGQLYGGSSSCKSPSSYDYYGRFDLAYAAGLESWLTVEKPTTGKSAIFRFYNTKSATHFFTGSQNERDSVISKYASFIYEGEAFYAYPKTGNTLSPVYRFFHKKLGSHFYTISRAEKENIEIKYPNYIYEGISWYAAPTVVADSKPLYRFYNTKTGTHFYTVSTAEKDNIINKYRSYIYEGIAYYVWTKK